MQIHSLRFASASSSSRNASSKQHLPQVNRNSLQPDQKRKKSFNNVFLPILLALAPMGSAQANEKLTPKEVLTQDPNIHLNTDEEEHFYEIRNTVDLTGKPPFDKLVVVSEGAQVKGKLSALFIVVNPSAELKNSAEATLIVGVSGKIRGDAKAGWGVMVEAEGEVAGSVSSPETIVISGRVGGSVKSASLTIEKTGNLTGSAEAQAHMSIAGKVGGNLILTGKDAILFLYPGAQFRKNSKAIFKQGGTVVLHGNLTRQDIPKSFLQGENVRVLTDEE